MNLVVLHGQESQYDAKDKTEIINIRALQNKYIDYPALGHLHEYKYQKLDNRGSYCYCGCLEGRGFDECGEKGFVLLDIQENKVVPSFIPFAKRRLYELLIDISDCHTTGEIAGKIDGRVTEVDEGSLVKLVLTGEIEMDTDVDFAYILKRYQQQFYFVKVKDKTRLAVNYEDYRLDQSLKGEFIRLLENANLPQDEKDAVILTGIRALSGEEI